MSCNIDKLLLVYQHKINYQLMQILKNYIILLKTLIQLLFLRY